MWVKKGKRTIERERERESLVEASVFVVKLRDRGSPYYRKLTLHEIKVLEINAT